MSRVPEIAKLSNTALIPGKRWSDVFLAKECLDFHSVCNWLWKLSYGSNTGDGLDALLQDNCGTCTTKHGIAAELASELNLPIYKFLVYYKLDGSVRAGADSVLRDHALPFVPCSHCVLMEGTLCVDLTWGNTTGKLKDLEDFELYVKVEPHPSRKDREAIDAWALMWYAKQYPELEKSSHQEIESIRRRCICAAEIQCAC